MKLWQILEKSKRLKRYLLLRLKYITLKKIVNYITTEYSFLTKKTFLTSYPYELIIETTNICNLKCPLCFTGRHIYGREKCYMDYTLFKNIIDELAPYTFHCFLYHQGESLLHKDITKFISYAHKSNIGTTISSNLSFHVGEKEIEDIINSKLDTFVVSLDGVTQDIYQKYRVGGDIEQVISNIKLLVRKKNEMKSKTPYIEWQYIVMKHNEHQINAAKRITKELGADSIVFINVLLPHLDYTSVMRENWLPINDKYRNKFLLDKSDDLLHNCWWPWRVAVIHCDGGVSPCAFSFYQDEDLGRYKNPFIKLWNSKKLLLTRKYLNNKHIVLGENIACYKCNAYM